MSIYLDIKKSVLAMPEGALFSTQELEVPSAERANMQKSVSELFKKGILKRLSKSLYYRPIQTEFGELPPSSAAILLKLMEIYQDQIAYVTGASAYTRLGLTTQWTPEITVASDRPRRYPLEIGKMRVRFVPSRVTLANANTYLLLLLDAAKDIGKIAGSTPTKVAQQIQRLIKQLSRKEKGELVSYAFDYPASTRALIGLLLEREGKKTLAKQLRSTLSPLSAYKIGLETEYFPTAANWNLS